MGAALPRVGSVAASERHRRIRGAGSVGAPGWGHDSPSGRRWRGILPSCAPSRTEEESFRPAAAGTVRDSPFSWTVARKGRILRGRAGMENRASPRPRPDSSPGSGASAPSRPFRRPGPTRAAAAQNQPSGSRGSAEPPRAGAAGAQHQPERERGQRGATPRARVIPPPTKGPDREVGALRRAVAAAGRWSVRRAVSRAVSAALCQARGVTRSVSRVQCHAFWGKPRLMPPWLGSSQRDVTTLPRVKKCTPSVPWAWVSPNRLFFQPPKE